MTTPADTPDGIDLTADEAQCLAQRLCARLLADAVEDGALDWEMVPLLSERAWDRLVLAVEVVAREVKGRADMLDTQLRIDSRDLLGRAQ